MPLLFLLFMDPLWVAVITNVEGVFLHAWFESREELNTNVPDGFKEWYPGNVVLRMNVTLYDTNQAAYCYFLKFKR